MHADGLAPQEICVATNTFANRTTTAQERGPLRWWSRCKYGKEMRKDHRDRERAETGPLRMRIYGSRERQSTLVGKEGGRLLVESAGKVRQIRNGPFDGLAVLDPR